MKTNLLFAFLLTAFFSFQAFAQENSQNDSENQSVYSEDNDSYDCGCSCNCDYQDRKNNT